MKKKVLVILGHPQPQSYCGALADAYRDGAREAAADVRVLTLAALELAPAAGGSEPSPDVRRAQDDIRWAEHLVFVYPILWGTIPALLKAFIERSFLPGFAVNFREGALGWDRLLAGRSARLIVTMNTPPWLYRWMFGRPGHNTMKRAILKFSGVTPVRISQFGPVNRSNAVQRSRWLDAVRALGRRVA
ncbi:MAG TPA: NAD(P)H-dependent oxidoreductase [Acidiferrobacterales bacterium]